MRRGAVRRFLRRADGTAALEFALIAPVLLILFAGLVNVGFRLREESRLNQATRETAEAGMFTRDLAVLRQTLDNALAELGTPTGGGAYSGSVTLVCLCPGQADIANCSITQARSCTSTGLPWEIVIEVGAQVDYRPLIPLVGGAASQRLQSTMRVQVR